MKTDAIPRLSNYLRSERSGYDMTFISSLDLQRKRSKITIYFQLTVAGGGGSGISGDGGPAFSTNTKMNAPQGVYHER